MRPVSLQLHDVLARPLVPIVQEVGLRGMPFSAEIRDQFVWSLGSRLHDLDERLARSGITAQNSPRQLGWQLKELGVPLTQLTASKSQFKVDLEVLGRLDWNYNVKRERAGLAGYYPFLPLLMEHAKLTKARENLQSYTPCFDGKIRTRLNACQTRTARYSSSGFGRANAPGYCPVDRVWGAHGANLQNVPRKDEVYGVNVKDCFVAQPGWKIGELDYKALELFIEAYRINSSLAISELEGGANIHARNAKRMFAALAALDDETIASKHKPQRVLAKNFRYALRGGGGDRAIQIALAKGGEFVELRDIDPWRKAVFAVYPEVPLWIESTLQSLKAQATRGERRVIRNAFGRPRVLMGNEPLKEALATEISGTGADLMNFTLARLAYEHPRAFGAIVAQIHDSYLLYAPAAEIDDHMRVVQREMERHAWVWGHFRSFPVEGKIGDCWGKLSDWKG